MSNESASEATFAVHPLIKEIIHVHHTAKSHEDWKQVDFKVNHLFEQTDVIAKLEDRLAKITAESLSWIESYTDQWIRAEAAEAALSRVKQLLAMAERVRFRKESEAGGEEDVHED